MPTVNNRSKSSIPRSHHIFSFIGVLFLMMLVASTFVAFAHSSRSTAAHATGSTSFGFTYTGDYDNLTETTANLQYIAQQYKSGNISFNIGLGDFSYAKTVTPAVANAWSNYAKGILTPSLPFEILDGRHDSSQIKTYETDLPNQIGNLSASCATLTPCTYGEQYYFDYPQPTATPLARFIMISPNQTIPGHTYNYNQGGADYNWVKSVIDDAHTNKIPWVIVGMHEYCFVIGTASCLNQQLLDLLLSEHVDLILQGQKHNYQASNQLALNDPNCQTTTPCAINNVDSTASMTQGAGSVILVTGTGGGQPPLAITPSIAKSDPKSAYFRTWTPGSLSNVTYGVSQFTITQSQLSEQFVSVSGGCFKDSFTITNPSATPTTVPTVTASPNPCATPTPTGTPGATLAQDTFKRTNQIHWGTASDGKKWGADANANTAFSIASNSGQIKATSNISYNATLGAAPPSKATSAQVEFTGSISSFSTANMGATLSYTNKSNWYEAYIDGTNLTIVKQVKGTPTVLASIGFLATANTQYTLLFSISGGSFNSSVWQTTGGSQPGSWMLSIPIGTPSVAAGSCGLHVVVQSGVTVTFNSFQASWK